MMIVSSLPPLFDDSQKSLFDARNYLVDHSAHRFLSIFMFALLFLSMLLHVLSPKSALVIFDSMTVQHIAERVD